MLSFGSEVGPYSNLLVMTTFHPDILSLELEAVTRWDFGALTCGERGCVL